MSNGGLVIAVPSKGRLQENAALFFGRAGLDLVMPGERSYRGRLKGVEGVEVAYLSASEIARELSIGNVHLGVTGKDLIEEGIDNWAARLDMTLPLGFGFADVVVAVPQGWIDVHSMFDLDDIAGEFRWRHGRSLKVATKYINLTRRFFAAHGIADYRIVESLGATEGAPASGAADLIVDITTTGATLRGNGLKVLSDGLILASEAHLVTSLVAKWTKPVRASLRTILDRIEAEAAGRSQVVIRADAKKPEEAAREAARRFGASAPFHAKGEAVLVLHCPKAAVEACADWLRESAGAETVTVSKLERVFDAAAATFDRLNKRLPKG
ncbi:MAG: ATP phosphoribosyltransferase [Bauldia sp.]|nr:ATP phosphoribosyltransferase [Bauldia sp.]